MLKSDAQTSYLVGGGELLPMNSPLNSRMKTFLLTLPYLADPKVDFSFKKGFLWSTLLVLKLEPTRFGSLIEAELKLCLCEESIDPASNLIEGFLLLETVLILVAINC